MTQQHRTVIAPMAALAVALMLPAAAEASEVVKLARLVITGKRLSAEPPAQAAPQLPPQQLPRVLVEGQRADTSPRVLAGRRAALRVL